MGALEEDHQVLIYTLYQPTDRSYLTLPCHQRTFPNLHGPVILEHFDPTALALIRSKTSGTSCRQAASPNAYKARLLADHPVTIRLTPVPVPGGAQTTHSRCTIGGPISEDRYQGLMHTSTEHLVSD
jgi:hypothetical protein